VTEEHFSGFPKACLDFYTALSRNNNKAWFESNRSVFEKEIMAPARAFVSAMGERLDMLAPGIHAEPKVNRSLFRINRDTRFSKDKTPYKTHLAVWFWEGQGPRMECSGFYFHLQPDQLILGTGIYCFSKPQLAQFRESAIHPEYGPSLRTAFDQASAKGFEITGRHYKRIPRGFDPDHPNADLLLFNGLAAAFRVDPPPQLHSVELVDYCLGYFVDMNPIHRWLVELTERSLA
jgi:uncharacterized protein (TIGR02453 family)